MSVTKSRINFVFVSILLAGLVMRIVYIKVRLTAQHLNIFYISPPLLLGRVGVAGVGGAGRTIFR